MNWIDLPERLWRAHIGEGMSPNTSAKGRILWAGVLSVVASGAAADMACSFGTECFDGEACGESGFSLSIVGDAMETEFGSYPVQDLGGALYAAGDGAHYLLTTGDSGARLSVHMDGPMVVSYLGTCE